MLATLDLSVFLYRRVIYYLLWLSEQVEQACLALSSLAADVSLVLRLMRADVIHAIELVLRSSIPELLISVLQVIANLSFTSDAVASKVLTKEIFKRLKLLCGHNHSEVCHAHF